MAARRVVRAIPSVFVGVLVLVSAAAQSGPANPFRRLLPVKGGAFAQASRSTPTAVSRERSADIAGITDIPCRSVTYTAAVPPPVSDAVVWQPDAVTITASTLSFALSTGNGFPGTRTAEIAFFEPGSPDPRGGAYALHRCTLTASGNGAEWLAYPMDREIVVRSIDPNVVTSNAALSYASNPDDPHVTLFEPAGPSEFRPAMFEIPGVGLTPLPGPNPVIAHEVCGATPGDDGLYVVRQVIRSDLAATPTAELVQTFTSAVTATVEWVEIAIAAGSDVTPLQVVLFDMQGALQPPASALPSTLTSTILEGALLSPPVWGASVPLTTPAYLEAGHRYGLGIVCSGVWSAGAAQSTGGLHYPDGDLYTRAASTGPFIPATDLDLSFRLIGRPTATASLPPECDAPAISRAVTFTAHFPVPAGRTVVQPLTIVGDNFAVSRVAFEGPGTWTADLFLELAPPGSHPDEGRIALREAGKPAAGCDGCGWPIVDIERPVVVTSVAGVADGDGDFAMLSWRADPATINAEIGYDGDATSQHSPALYRDGGGPWQPLPGSHPVVAHVVCPSTLTSSGPWKAVQQVLRHDIGYPGTATAELRQTFRVPVTTEVSWAELGARFTGNPSPLPLAVGLAAPGPCTCTSEPDFDLGLGQTFVESLSGFGAHSTLTSSLRATESFPYAITLTAGVDYVINVTSTADWDLAAKDASPYTEGRLFMSQGSGLPYAEETDRDLAFRLIGVPRTLMAGPPTHTCDPCPTNVFAAVTITADFGTDQPRAFAQVLTITRTAGIERMQLPLGTDGGAVTITMRLTFTETGPEGFAVPSSSTYPLTNATLTASGGDMTWSRVDYDRSISVLRWAGGPSTQTAEDVGILVEPPVGQLQGRAKVALGDPAVCTCTALLARTGSSWEPMPGLSLGHVLGPTSETAEPDPDRFEMAGVRRVDGATVTADIVQVFRVPVVCRVDWVELAIPGGQLAATPFQLSIVDPAGFSAPGPGSIPQAATATAQFGRSPSMDLGDTWAAATPFATPVVLLPGRDYWLSARLPGDWHLATAATATAEDGRLYTRPVGNGTWTQVDGPLAFRMIGGSLTPTDVPPIERPAGLTLSAEPQPFTRELLLRWSGGTGRMSVEIFDARGRRVRQVRDAGMAVRGSWTWHGEDDFGRAVGAGVYFARVTPTVGPAMRRRVVYLR